MALLEDLAPGMMLKGIRPQTAVTIVAVTRHGADSAEIVYKDTGAAWVRNCCIVMIPSNLRLCRPHCPGLSPQTARPFAWFRRRIVFAWPTSLIL
jgi:hypothetical protein